MNSRNGRISWAKGNRGRDIGRTPEPAATPEVLPMRSPVVCRTASGDWSIGIRRDRSSTSSACYSMCSIRLSAVSLEKRRLFGKRFEQSGSAGSRCKLHCDASGFPELSLEITSAISKNKTQRQTRFRSLYSGAESREFPIRHGCPIAAWRDRRFEAYARTDTR